MYRSATTVVAISAMLFASALYAQQTDTTHEEKVGQIQIKAIPTYKLAPREFDNYAYTYDLSTGDSIRLRESSGRYFAHLNNEREVEIFGERPGVFQSTSGTQIAFRDTGDTVLVTNPGRLPGAPRALAALPAETVLMASR